MNLPEDFGCMVFSDRVMAARLPKDTYSALKKVQAGGMPLELEVANVVASGMRTWAMEKGATHFTHWFQPMTGVTAEKHDSFLSPDGSGGALMEFSGKSLVKGEPDASSFPSGGLRATFEARGYTAWDPTSYAFLKDGVLCIPTAFCAYSGEALDKKTPLLRSMEALERQALRILRLFGDTGTVRVVPQVGPEQEYFLLDREMYLRRPDLVTTGRTLLGAQPPKGQELEDHYFGALKKRVKAYMTELDQELWKLGVYAKTEHNEVAPSQHELAPVFGTANLATDGNQLTMELMKSIAAKHGLVCLLHEKPFAGVNGSGKHNNWSLSTGSGLNLLEPGETPGQNAQFLLFLCGVLKAVDDYQDLLRASVATAGNDHRLGASEAPPAIVSVFLGEELTGILDAIRDGALYVGHAASRMESGAAVLPRFLRDTTDRNRTSPFAFTGNKFEFRMPGSALSIAGPNIVLNTIVAQALSEFADVLEQGSDFRSDLEALIRTTIGKHHRIIFNGNGYEDAWVQEARRRGLSNLWNTPEALPALVSDRSIALFARHRVFSEAELRSRYDILLGNYCKTLNIEALTLIDLVNKQVIPDVLAYEDRLAEVIGRKKAAREDLPCRLEADLLLRLSVLSDCLAKRLGALEEQTAQVKQIPGLLPQARGYREKVFTAMAELRACVDELELLVAKDCWTLPTYGELLYSVNE